MGQHLLSIRILFHTTFVFVYLTIIPIVQYIPPSRLWTRSSLGSRPAELSFVRAHFDGLTALSAFVGLGIFAALDILTIRRKVNHYTFLIIEIIVVALMPLSMWPIIVAAICVVWPTWYLTRCNDWTLISWYCRTLGSIALPIHGDEITSTVFIAATVATLALSAGFLLYISIAAVTAKVRGNNFLPIHPGDRSLSAPRMPKNCYLWGNQRTPTERAVIVGRCTDYIFRNSVFRKHAFEPTKWAIFRGIIAVYSCLGLVVFSAYSAISEAQLRGTLTVHETITMASPYDLLRTYFTLSVASFLMGPQAASDVDPMPSMNVTSQQNPPPTFSGNNTSGNWQNPTPGFWGFSEGGLLPNFNISWTGEYALVTWVTTDGCSMRDNMYSVGTGSLNSTQVNWTNPLVLAPFQQYHISLIGVEYILPDCEFTQWIPDVIRSVDSGSGSNTSIASFSFNGYQPQVLVREFSSPSVFSSVAHVLSDIGGTLSFIDGLFALVFGRTIVAIIFGTRIVSPFGLLGMVTHNRFKRLIKEQYPRMQEDIEQGGMAAYISEVAIDAALIDEPSTTGNTSSIQSSLIGDTEEAGGNIELVRRPTGSSASYFTAQSSLVSEELESTPLVGSQTN